MPKAQYRIRVGRLWNVQPIPGRLLYALQESGLDFVTACWLLLRRSIVLGGGESRYDPFRKALARALEGGE